MKQDMKQSAEPTTTYLIDFCHRLLSGPFATEAKAVFEVAEAVSPTLHTFRTTPQSPPHHAEGITLYHNITRTLAGLFALQGDVLLRSFEEFAREKSLFPEIDELEQTLRNEKTLLEVFVLTHDLGKPETVSFDAPKGSLGEREGFRQHDRRIRKEASEIEKQTYYKLLKAFETQHRSLEPHEVSAAFYDRYEISVHYDGHAKKSVLIRYEKEVRAIADVYKLSSLDMDLLKFLIENHMQAIAFGSHGVDALFYELVIARAEKTGLDADRALDALTAALFLDGTVGTLHYETGRFTLQTDAVFAMLASEEAVAGYRRRARRERMAKREQDRLKRILKDAGLGAETVFALLHTPFGPERGLLMEEIERAVRESTYHPAFPSHQTELMVRIDRARNLFDGREIA